MTDALKRPCYRDGGLLLAKDYANAQVYLAEIQALRDRSLHTWGIADGLDVAPVPGRLAVTVTPGMAVDAGGRQIVLDRTTMVDLTNAGMPLTVFLTLTASVDDAAWRSFPRGGGYTRRVETAVLALAGKRPDDGERILLAKLTITKDGRLWPPDPSGRRYCGLRVGRLVFPRPGAIGDRLPRMEMADDGAAGALAVTAQRTNIFGSMSVAGRVVVGAAVSPLAAAGAAPVREPPLLAVQPETSLPGFGRITVADGVAFGDSARTMAALRRGDVLKADGRRLRVAATLGRRAVSLAAAPHEIRSSGYVVVPNVVAWVRTGDLADALCVKDNGVVGIGREPADQVQAGTALVVGHGDVRLDEGMSVQFPKGGTVAAGKGEDHALRFDDGGLAVRSTGDIGFFTGRLAPDAPPDLIATPRGQIGIGVSVVGSTLTVNGAIRVSGGLVFPDGTVQKDAISDLPVGAVIDWWRLPGDSRKWSREGFQLCDGGEIVDPASPLCGQKTPDLSERFVRGVVNLQDIGSTGGTEKDHEHLLAPHTHGMPHQHDITGQTGGPTVLATAAAGGRAVSADHVHSIGARSGDADPDKTGPPVYATGSGETGSAPSTPVFVDLLKVMRIK